MAGLGGGGLGSAAVRAGRAFVELYANDNRVYQALDRLKNRFQAFAGFSLKVGAALGAAGTAGVAGFKPALDALGEQAKIGDLAELFGITAEKASRLFGIMAAGGSDLRDAQEGLATFNQKINDALTGKGDEAKDLFRELGVGAQEFAQLDVADRFYRLLDAVKASGSPLGKLGLLMKAVGEDTGKNLGGVLTMTADQMRQLGDAMESSAEDIQAAREATRAQAQATALLGKAWREVAAAVAPTVKETAEQVVGAAKAIGGFIRNNREAVATVFKVAAGLVVAGAAFIALGTTAAAVAAAIGGFASVAGLAWGAVVLSVKLVAAAVSALLSPYGLVAAAVAGLAYLFVTQTEAGERLWDALRAGARGVAAEIGDAFRTVSRIGTDAWGGIVAAVKGGDLELAGAIAVAALELVWAKAVARMTEIWNGFTRPIVETWHEVTDGLGAVFATMGDIVTEVFTEIWAVAKEVFAAVKEAVTDAVAAVKEAFEGVRETVTEVLGLVAPLLAPLVAPFLALAALIEQAWDGLSTNLMETLNNFTAWAEKSFIRVSDAIENAFKQGARWAIDAAIRVARVLDTLDPQSALGLSRFAPLIESAELLRNGIGADITDEETNAKIGRIENERKFFEDQLRAERAKGRAARDAERAADEAGAEKKADEIEQKLRDLLAKARALEARQAVGGAAGAIAQALAGARPGGQLAATIAGSHGTFSAVAAAQRFGGPRTVEKKLGDIADNTAATVRAAEGIAKALTFK